MNEEQLNEIERRVNERRVWQVYESKPITLKNLDTGEETVVDAGQSYLTSAADNDMLALIAEVKRLQRSKAVAIQAMHLLKRMTGLTDWQREGYTTDEYNDFVKFHVFPLRSDDEWNAQS